MAESAEEGIGVWREVHSGSIRFKIQDCADEGWVLMGKAVMFLTCPSRGLDVINAGDIFSPGGFPCLERC